MSETQTRIAANLTAAIYEADPAWYAQTARHSGTRYYLPRQQEFGAQLLAAAVLGDLEETNKVSQIARKFGVTRKLVETFVGQPDYKHGGRFCLNFVGEAIARTQAQELLLLVPAMRKDGLVVVRSQPTVPAKHMHCGHGGVHAYGIDGQYRLGAVDTPFVTIRTCLGLVESIGIGGYVQASDADRAACLADPDRRMGLSDLHRLSLDSPSAALFAGYGASWRVVESELPEGTPVIHLILQARFDGPSPSPYLLRDTRNCCIINESGYGKAARENLGDEALIVVQATDQSPDTHLERHHNYVPFDGPTITNDQIRRYRVGDYYDYAETELYAEAPEDGIEGILLPGDFRSTLPDSKGDCGQALLMIVDGAEPRWYSVLNRADGSRALTGSEQDIQRQLQKIIDAFALVDGTASPAGPKRREQYDSLAACNLPLSNPCARENWWREAALVRLGHFPDALFPALV